MTGESKRQNPPRFRAYLALLLLLCFGAQALNAQSFQAKTPPMTRVIVRTRSWTGWHSEPVQDSGLLKRSEPWEIPKASCS